MELKELFLEEKEAELKHNLLEIKKEKKTLIKKIKKLKPLIKSYRALKYKNKIKKDFF